MKHAMVIRAALAASVLAALPVVSPAALAGAPGGRAVEVRGLRITGPGLSENELRPFNWTEGTTVALLVRTPGGAIIALDEDGSALETFSDDKGTDLLAAKRSGGFSPDPGYGRAEIAGDGKACLLEVSSTGLPAEGARTLRLKGALAVKVADGRKTFRQQKVAAKEGTAIQAGPIPLAIEKVGPPDWGGDDAKLAVTLSAKQDLAEIAGIRFLDAKGKEIPSSRSGTSSMSMGERKSVSWTYDLNEKATSFTIEITYWIDVREIRIPYALEVGVGLR
ncbi:MAG: hypothetical protein JXP34_03850 [Planctomycetes bacterium]|nr:hypothetical protein [Planctomycetota bacterium]